MRQIKVSPALTTPCGSSPALSADFLPVAGHGVTVCGPFCRHMSSVPITKYEKSHLHPDVAEVLPAEPAQFTLAVEPEHGQCSISSSVSSLQRDSSTLGHDEEILSLADHPPVINPGKDKSSRRGRLLTRLRKAIGRGSTKSKPPKEPAPLKRRRRFKWPSCNKLLCGRGKRDREEEESYMRAESPCPPSPISIHQQEQPLRLESLSSLDTLDDFEIPTPKAWAKKDKITPEEHIPSLECLPIEGSINTTTATCSLSEDGHDGHSQNESDVSSEDTIKQAQPVTPPSSDSPSTPMCNKSLRKCESALIEGSESDSPSLDATSCVSSKDLRKCTNPMNKSGRMKRRSKSPKNKQDLTFVKLLLCASTLLLFVASRGDVISRCIREKKSFLEKEGDLCSKCNKIRYSPPKFGQKSQNKREHHKFEREPRLRVVISAVVQDAASDLLDQVLTAFDDENQQDRENSSTSSITDRTSNPRENGESLFTKHTKDSLQEPRPKSHELASDIRRKESCKHIRDIEILITYILDEVVAREAEEDLSKKTHQNKPRDVYDSNMRQGNTVNIDSVLSEPNLENRTPELEYTPRVQEDNICDIGQMPPGKPAQLNDIFEKAHAQGDVEDIGMIIEGILTSVVSGGRKDEAQEAESCCLNNAYDGDTACNSNDAHQGDAEAKGVKATTQATACRSGHIDRYSVDPSETKLTLLMRTMVDVMSNDVVKEIGQSHSSQNQHETDLPNKLCIEYPSESGLNENENRPLANPNSLVCCWYCGRPSVAVGNSLETQVNFRRHDQNNNEMHMHGNFVCCTDSGHCCGLGERDVHTLLCAMLDVMVVEVEQTVSASETEFCHPVASTCDLVDGDSMSSQHSTLRELSACEQGIGLIKNNPVNPDPYQPNTDAMPVKRGSPTPRAKKLKEQDSVHCRVIREGMLSPVVSDHPMRDTYSDIEEDISGGEDTGSTSRENAGQRETTVSRKSLSTDITDLLECDNFADEVFLPELTDMSCHVVEAIHCLIGQLRPGLPMPKIIDENRLCFMKEQNCVLRLGGGRQGIVLLGAMEGRTVELVAIKLFLRRCNLHRVLQEASLLTLLNDSEATVRCHGLVGVSDDPVFHPFAMVMEFLGEADVLRTVTLEDYLYRTAPSCPDGIPIVKVLYTLAEKLKLLHSCKVYLNDIKFDNIMFSKNERGWIVRFIDLGNAVYDYHRVRLGLNSAEQQEALRRFPQLAPEYVLHEFCGSITDVYGFGRLLALAGHYCRLEPVRLMGELCLVEDPNERFTISRLCVAMRNLVSYLKLLQKDADAFPLDDRHVEQKNGIAIEM